MRKRDEIGWLGTMRGGRIVVDLSPAEVLKRVRDAVPESLFGPFHADVGRQSFTMWRYRQIPRLHARLETSNASTAIHYEVTAHPAWFVVQPAFMLVAPAVLSFMAQDATLLLFYVLAIPMAVVLTGFMILFSRISSRTILNQFHLILVDLLVVESRPPRIAIDERFES